MLLSNGLDLRMSKVFDKYKITDTGVQANFADGTVYGGKFLIGCEGAQSQGKRHLNLT